MSHCGRSIDNLPTFGKLAVRLYFLVGRPSVASPFLNLNIRQTLTAKTRPLRLGFTHLSVADSIVPLYQHINHVCWDGTERMVTDLLQDRHDIVMLTIWCFVPQNSCNVWDLVFQGWANLTPSTTLLCTVCSRHCSEKGQQYCTEEKLIKLLFFFFFFCADLRLKVFTPWYQTDNSRLQCFFYGSRLVFGVLAPTSSLPADVHLEIVWVMRKYFQPP